MTKNNKYDTIRTGLITGILLPMLLLLLILQIRSGEFGFEEYLKQTYELKLLPKIISLCLFLNLALFFIFLRLNMLKAGKGIIIAMFIAGSVIILLKLI